jgi:hypothetical protein
MNAGSQANAHTVCFARGREATRSAIVHVFNVSSGQHFAVADGAQRWCMVHEDSKPEWTEWNAHECMVHEDSKPEWTECP